VLGLRWGVNLPYVTPALSTSSHIPFIFFFHRQVTHVRRMIIAIIVTARIVANFFLSRTPLFFL
jgi:hypothetical protein